MFLPLLMQESARLPQCLSSTAINVNQNRGKFIRSEITLDYNDGVNFCTNGVPVRCVPILIWTTMQLYAEMQNMTILCNY